MPPIVKLDDPPLDHQLTEMKHIGPYFLGRLRRSHLRTGQQVINRLNRNTRARNELWMRRIFANRRATECVDPTHTDRASRPGIDYAVHPINITAYNHIIDYGRWNGVPAFRLPRKIPRRPLHTKYPARCTTG